MCGVRGKATSEKLAPQENQMLKVAQVHNKYSGARDVMDKKTLLTQYNSPNRQNKTPHLVKINLNPNEGWLELTRRQKGKPKWGQLKHP